MKRIVLSILFVLLCACVMAQEVQPVSLARLEQVWKSTNDTTYVINFWATWCAPCIKELPHFEQARTKYAHKKVKILLVSLDFVSQLDKKVKPFVKKRNLKSEVWLLNERDQNEYIERIEPTWSGAIPATLVVNAASRKRQFLERELSNAELTKAIDEFVQ